MYRLRRHLSLVALLPALVHSKRTYLVWRKMKFLLKKKNLVLISLAAVTVLFISLLLTFLISDGNKAATNGVFRSADVMKTIGRVEKIILTGSSSKYSGSAGCADFRYLVVGEAGMEIVNVRVEKTDGSGRTWRVLELTEGLGADFNRSCWSRTGGDGA